MSGIPMTALDPQISAALSSAASWTQDGTNGSRDQTELQKVNENTHTLPKEPAVRTKDFSIYGKLSGAFRDPPITDGRYDGFVKLLS